MNFKWFRRIIGTAFIALFILASYDQAYSPLTAADGDDEVDGVLTSQNFNNAAEFTNFKLVTASGTTSIVTDNAITPQQSYTAEVTINDPDGIRDITSVAIRFFNASYAGINSETPAAIRSDFDQATATNVSGQELVVQWNYGEDGFSVVYESSVTSGAVSWELVDSETPTGAALLGTSFTFEVTFKPSKVAQESTSNLRWFFGGIINDGRISLDDNERQQQNPQTIAAGLRVGEGYNPDATPSYWQMNWYGEISVSTEEILWSDLPAGITFGAIGKSVTTISGIRYIANGDYDSQIASDKDNWQAVMTASLAAVLFDGFTTSDWTAFNEVYSQRYTTYSSLYYMPEADGNARTINSISSMVGIPYVVINDAASRISTGNFNGFSILLPLSIEGVNQTGAGLVVLNSDSVGYSDLLDATTDNKDHQYFAVAYKNHGVGSSSESVTLNGTWYLIGDEAQNQWRSFRDEAQEILNVRSFEAGQTGDLALYIQLSDIFQNAEYVGQFQLKIVNR